MSRPSSDGRAETPMTQGQGCTLAFQTDLGFMYQGDSEKVLRQHPHTDYIGRVQLILTSPPFPSQQEKEIRQPDRRSILEMAYRDGSPISEIP